MCNCFKNLETQAKEHAKINYPNSKLLRVEIERNRGEIDKPTGYVSMNYVFEGKKGVYRRSVISVENDWKYCPLCGKKI